jgi:hypothetical protein
LLILIVPMGFLAGALQWPKTWRELDESDLLFLAVVVAGLLVCLPGSKAGSGSTHLLPLAPYTGFLFAHSLRRGAAQPGVGRGMIIAAVWLMAGSAASLLKAHEIWTTCRARPPLEAAEDLSALLQRYPPAQMQMGIGDFEHYPLTFCSPRLYRFGAPRLLEGSSWMDMKASGLNATPLERELQEKSFRFWLFPHGDQPFTLRSWYDQTPLFTESIRDALLRNYAIVESTPWWDVYEARPSR